MANYVIGDIQGCYDSLQSLLSLINFTRQHDTLWIAGDLVNRGPKSLETLRFLKSLGDDCNVVLGNHDLHMIAVAECCDYGKQAYRQQSKDTFDSVLKAEDGPELIKWLRHQSLVKHITVNQKLDQKHNQQRFIISHAGLPPIWSSDQALRYSLEVENILVSKARINFLHVMYGNTPNQWQDDLGGYDRLRVITNYLTRMRFCNAQGQLELSTKGSPDQTPKNFKPWFEFNNPQLGTDKIVFGHWAALEGKTQNPQIFAIDTGCVWGKTLTALRLEDEKLFSCAAQE